jgi:hypothetical protein
MKRVIDLSAEDAKKYFLKQSSYFREDFPGYISFQPIIDDVSNAMGGKAYLDFLASIPKPDSDKMISAKPSDFADVNYKFTANKDGRFGWRPYELIHPVIYVSLVNLVCEPANWKTITDRFDELEAGIVECCSAPVISDGNQSDIAAQVRGWWLEYEQKSIALSLDFTHLLQSDVTDCYGSLYTHSIAWALHGYEDGKKRKADKSLLGNNIDRHIQASRYGQTNGIVQGSALMDLVAELVLAYVDYEINNALDDKSNLRILRFRDDYRIFARSDLQAEEALKVVSDCLRGVGMRLGVEKTSMSTNVVEASLKPDKRAGIELRDMDIAQAKSLQKQLLRLHAFGRRFPNSGALKRLSAEALSRMEKIKDKPQDLEVQIAIVTDIASTSPQAFPPLAGILSHLISHATDSDKPKLWDRVANKMKSIPHNGYLEIWLQRVTTPLGIPFESKEKICRLVNGEDVALWNSDWIDHAGINQALDSKKIVVGDATGTKPTMQPEEVELFTRNAEFS